MHSRRIALSVQPVSRTPSLVKRLRTEFAIRLVRRFDRRVLPLRAISTHEIGTAFYRGDEFPDVRRIILQIAIDQDRYVATRRL